MIGPTLRANGYATSRFDKDHNTPSYQSRRAGPFDQWPNGMGFEYFYSSVGGNASRWQPNLLRKEQDMARRRNGCRWSPP